MMVASLVKPEILEREDSDGDDGSGEEKVLQIRTLTMANVSVSVLMQRWKRSMVPVKPVSMLTRVRNKMWRRPEQAKQDAIDALEAAKEAADKDQENGHMTPKRSGDSENQSRGSARSRGIYATRTTDQSNWNGGSRSRSPC